MALFGLVITKSAAKDIAKLDDVVKKRLQKKLVSYLNQPDPLAFAKRLTDSRLAEWRWRIGNYRILFDIDGQKLVILAVRHRREVYRK